MFELIKNFVKSNPVATAFGIGIIVCAFGYKYITSKSKVNNRKSFFTIEQLRPADVSKLESYGFEHFIHAASKSTHVVTLWARRADGRWFFGTGYSAQEGAAIIEYKIHNPYKVDEHGRLQCEPEEVYPEAPIW